jgi:hypothetical protein
MRITLALLFVLLAFGSGCGGGGDLPTVKAGGVVTIDNKPLANAHVIFTPNQGRAATAQTASDGTFSLGTYQSGDGAIVGHHHVSVAAREAGDGQLNRPGAPGMERPGRSLIPEKYASTATSGLEFDVSKDGKNTFEIQLSTNTP